MKNKKIYIKKNFFLTIKIIELLISVFILYNFSFKNIKKINKYSFYKKNPKISICIPIFNQERYLKRIIKNIQNQTIKDIEIVAINDCSLDNSLEILMKLAKKDLRIKIINNKRNRGVLYSRAMGILKTKGKYLIVIDADDEFEGPDNLEYLYNITKKINVDVITYKFLKNKPKKNGLYSYKEKIFFQPKILETSIKSNDYFIWNKMVKKEIFLKSIESLKGHIYGDKQNYADDEILSILIYKHANSMIKTNKVIYIYYLNKNSLVHKRNYFLYLSNLILWNQIFELVLKDMNDKYYLKRHVSRFLKIILHNKNLNVIKNNKILKNKYIKIFQNLINKYNYTKKLLEKLNNN